MLLQYGSALRTVGRPEEALRYISDAVENRRKNRPGTRYLAQMLQNQASVLIELGRYRNARQLLEEAGQIRAKVGQKEDRNYMAPRIKLALAEGNAGEATGLIERFFGPVPDSAPVSIRLLQNMQARGELALLGNDGKKAIATAHRMAEVIRSSHQEIYLRIWQSTAALVEGEGRLMENDPSGALPLLQRAIQNQSEMLEPSAPSRIQAQALLGVAYFDLGARAKARDLLTQDRSMLQKHPELSNRYLRPVYLLAARLAGSGRAVPSTKEN
jgi:tetratricopeptide (TPR) repeat protein